MRSIVYARIASVVVAVALLAVPASSAINFSYLTPGVPVKAAGSIPKIALLTFDDGPDANTVKIARYLSGEKVPAAFFFVGKKVAANPTAADEVASLGFEVCNHSMNHLDLARADSQVLEKEITSCNDAILSATGKKPSFFRPPYGAFSRRLIASAEAQGLTSLLWTVDPFDWAEPGPSVVRDRVLSTVRPGAVILLHSNHEQTFQALPGIVDGLRQKGYKLVSIGEWFKTVVGHTSGDSPAPKLKPQQSTKEQSLPVQPKAQPSLTPALSSKVLKVASDESNFIYTNIGDENGLFMSFRAEGQLGGARLLEGLTWDDELASRIIPQYRDDFLLNRRTFADDYYPQPVYFLLTTLEDLPAMDQQFLRELVMQAGVAEMLVMEPGSGQKPEIGDFGVPARFISVAGFDATSVYELGTDNLQQLLQLYDGKKEAVFVMLSGSDFSSPEARTNLENASQLFRRFRQLTAGRYYDPASDLRGDWLPEGVSFARFTSESSPSLFCLVAPRSKSIKLPKRLQQTGIITLQVSGSASIAPLSGRTANVSPDPLYLRSD
jgi:peptidoglycan/xylan/chitin deacetylase (PgdA/CDA1 family)